MPLNLLLLLHLFPSPWRRLGVGVEKQGSCAPLLLKDQVGGRWVSCSRTQPIPQHRNTMTVILIKKLLKSLVTD